MPTNHSPGASSFENLFVDSDGSVWGATGDGLLRWKENRPDTLGTRNGLPCASINAAVADNRGSLWLDASCGYIAVPRTELETWWQQPGYRVKTTLLDPLDGPHAFPPDRFAVERRQALVRQSDGPAGDRSR